MTGSARLQARVADQGRPSYYEPKNLLLNAGAAWPAV